MTEKDYNQVIKDGKAVIVNCDFGFMTRVTPLENGRAKIECTVDAWEIRGQAEAEYVRKAVDSWSKRLAEYDNRKP